MIRFSRFTIGEHLGRPSPCAFRSQCWLPAHCFPWPGIVPHSVSALIVCLILADYCFAARFPKLPQPLIDELLPEGHGWRSDYGDPEKATDFAVLLAYSPIHNVRTPQQSPKQYPAMLLTTGDHDDRVVPLHSHKLLATLQHCAATDESDEQRNPLLSRIEVSFKLYMTTFRPAMLLTVRPQ